MAVPTGVTLVAFDQGFLQLALLFGLGPTADFHQECFGLQADLACDPGVAVTVGLSPTQVLGGALVWVVLGAMEPHARRSAVGLQCCCRAGVGDDLLFSLEVHLALGATERRVAQIFVENLAEISTSEVGNRELSEYVVDYRRAHLDVGVAPDDSVGFEPCEHEGVATRERCRVGRGFRDAHREG